MLQFFSRAVMGRRSLWVISLLVLSLMLNGCGQKGQDKSGQPASPDNNQPQQAFSLGTSSVGSTFYAISIGMADIINKQTGINLAVEPVGGSDANIRALLDKKVDIIMINAYSAFKASRGTGTASAGGGVPLRLIAQGQESLRNIVARKSSGIQTIADLKGKKLIAKRKSLPEIELTAKAVLKAYNLSENDVKILETAETNEAIEALKVGTADAAIIPGGVPASTLFDLAQSEEVIFLSLPDDKMELVIKELGPAFHKAVIPAGTYKGQAGEAKFPALSTDLIVQEDFPTDSAYRITKAIMEGKKELTAVHKEGKSWSLENTLQGPPLPFHPGAVKYFQEVGAWTPALEKLQQDQLKQ